jgi:hypothetical protein
MQDFKAKKINIATDVVKRLKKAVSEVLEKASSGTNAFLNIVMVVGIVILCIPIVIAVICLIGLALFYPVIALMWLAGLAKASGGIWWVYLFCGLAWNSDYLFK